MIKLESPKAKEPKKKEPKTLKTKTLKTKTLTVGIIAIIVIGIGVGITIPQFLLQTSPKYWSITNCPGAPSTITESQMIKFGVIGDIGELTGDAAWEGAWLAAYEINQAGGIVVNGTTYYIAITYEDTNEADINFIPTTGVEAVERLVNDKGIQFALGGFKSEAVLAYQEVLMDNEMVFLGCGFTTDIFCQNVLDWYDRYKYFFRVQPLNATSIALETFAFLAYIGGYLNVNRIGILYEDLTWTQGLVSALKWILPDSGFDSITGNLDVAFDLDVSAAEMGNHLNTLEGAGAQLVIPLISQQAGILMTTQYASLQPNFALVGVDVMAQLPSYWNETGGACEYLTIMKATTRTNKTELTIPFWDNFVSRWGHDPIYISIGTYDAMYLYKDVITSSQSFDSDVLVTELEKFNLANPRMGVSGYTAFTKGHDVREGWPYGVGLWAQWRKDPLNPGQGITFCVESGGFIYPDDIANGGPVQLPPWVGPF